MSQLPFHLPLLSLLIWTPIAGSLLVLFTGGESRVTYSRCIALGVSLLCIFWCMLLYMNFDNSTSAMQFQENLTWIPLYGINYHLGIDGISLPLIILTCYVTLLVVLAAWRAVQYKVSQYLAMFLLMQGTVIGVFVSLDAILFYVFWEAMLIPMYLSIGIWGAEKRSYASIKFFIFTFFGSALMLVAFLYMGIQTKSFSILEFYNYSFNETEQIFIFLAFLLAFAVKVPMWPVHTWLPDAHTEAPAGGSVVLAALMLKLGAYGFLRFNLPITPLASYKLDEVLIILSLIAIVYIGLIAIAQRDMKRLIAYSSVAHMGFVTLGIFMLYIIVQNTGDYREAYMSLEGGMVQMVSHAFGAGAMFLGFGVLYNQYKTRLISNFGGVAKTMPVFAAFFMLFSMSNVGLPGTSGFVGEVMILLASFKANFWITALAATTLILSAAYTLWMFRQVFYGNIDNAQVSELVDVHGTDICVFILLAAGILFIGLYPEALLNMYHASVGHLLDLSLRGVPVASNL